MLKMMLSTLQLSWTLCWQSFFQIPAASIRALCFFRNRNTEYVVVCDHIGDFIITLGYISAFQKMKKTDDITIVSTEKFSSFLTSFNVGYQFIDVNKNFLYSIVNIGRTSWGQRVLDHLANVTIINPVNNFTTNTFSYIVRFPNITLKDCIKYGALQLSESAEFILPKFNYPLKLRKDYSFLLKENNTVILAPYASILDTSEADIIFFENLASRLRCQGFHVLTNISSDKHAPLKGTVSLRCRLEELPTIVESAGYIVGLRSGLLDYLAYCNCTMVALYPHDYLYGNFFSLSMLEYTTASIYEHYLSGKPSDDLNQILHLITKF